MMAPFKTHPCDTPRGTWNTPALVKVTILSTSPNCANACARWSTVTGMRWSAIAIRMIELGASSGRPDEGAPPAAEAEDDDEEEDDTSSETWLEKSSLADWDKERIEGVGTIL